MYFSSVTLPDQTSPLDLHLFLTITTSLTHVSYIVANFERHFHEAEYHRTLGNEYIKQTNYRTAVQCYSVALDYATGIMDNAEQVLKE